VCGLAAPGKIQRIEDFAAQETPSEFFHKGDSRAGKLGVFTATQNVSSCYIALQHNCF
jgi:hypothetical protein